MIYDQEQHSTHLYLLISGKVELSCRTSDGRQVLVDLYQANDFFGESAFLGVRDCCDQVRVLAKALIMTWAISDVENLVQKCPQLGIALVQVLVRRNLECKGIARKCAI